MGIKRLLIAGATVAGLLSFIIYVEKPQQEEKRKQGFALGGAKSVQLSSIEVIKKGESWKLINTKVVEGELQDASAVASEVQNWHLASLPQAKLEEAPVRSIISSLIDLKTEESFTPDSDQSLSDFGLVDPQITATITVKGEEKKLYFGKRSDYLGKRYLKVGDAKELYLISDAPALALDKSILDLRSKAPISFDQDDLSSFSVQGANGGVRLKRENGLWSIQEPRQVSANNLAVGEIFRELRGLRVKSFIDNVGSDLTQWGLSNPKIKFQLFKIKEGEPPVEILLSTDKDGQSYLKMSNQSSVFVMEKVNFDNLNKDFKGLRNRRLFDFETWKVKKATIKTANAPDFIIDKNAEDWRVQGEAGDESFISQYFTDLSEVDAADYVDDPLTEESIKNATEVFSVQIILDDNKETHLKVIQKDGKLVGLPPAYPTEQFYLTQDALNKIQPKKEGLIKITTTPQVSDKKN